MVSPNSKHNHLMTMIWLLKNPIMMMITLMKNMMTFSSSTMASRSNRMEMRNYSTINQAITRVERI